MSLRVVCTCGHKMRFADNLAGKKVHCSECGMRIALPTAPENRELLRWHCGCGQRLKARRRLAGRRMRCPACGKEGRVPMLEPDATGGAAAAGVDIGRIGDVGGRDDKGSSVVADIAALAATQTATESTEKVEPVPDAAAAPTEEAADEIEDLKTILMPPGGDALAARISDDMDQVAADLADEALLFEEEDAGLLGIGPACPECKKPVGEKDKKCPHCGHKL